MDISVIIPLYNEAESLPELTAWIERVMKENSYTYEIIFINDGSTDNSWDIIEQLKEQNSRLLREIVDLKLENERLKTRIQNLEVVAKLIERSGIR